MSSMKIGIFGGTFDPPHNGHQLVASELLKQKVVDQIWFVPVYQHPWADRLAKKFAPYKHRVAMLKFIIGKSQQIKHFKQKSYTYDTLEFFRQKHPEHEFVWIMGSEYLPKFADFLSMHPRLMDYHFYIYPRIGYPRQPLYQNMTLLDKMPEIEVSSTQVRRLLEQKKRVDNLVDPKIEKYIKEHNIYSINNENKE